jgi:hypothetical protein
MQAAMVFAFTAPSLCFSIGTTAIISAMSAGTEKSPPTHITIAGIACSLKSSNNIPIAAVDKLRIDKFNIFISVLIQKTALKY